MAGNANTDGVNITDQTSSHKLDSYQESDIKELYKKAQPGSWQQLLDYVEKQGDSTWHITPGEAVAIKNAVQQALKSNAPFSDDPAQAYQELSKYGTQGDAQTGGSGKQAHARQH